MKVLKKRSVIWNGALSRKRQDEGTLGLEVVHDSWKKKNGSSTECNKKWIKVQVNEVEKMVSDKGKELQLDTRSGITIRNGTLWTMRRNESSVI